ncbi:hypothetical protein D3C87_2069190 [compost metagenome]
MRRVGTRSVVEIFELLFVDVGKNPGTHEHGIQASRLRTQNVVIDAVADADDAATVGDTC